ncbi:hypothetical protein [Klebsiella michiganensis]|uniref:hypothetical protein n=1 Tax=Klebsiella michiganensis TaxID=1134687 RepID=UPI00111D1D6F|nr:hypothetical protein [Klebsiella michiganensis]
MSGLLRLCGRVSSVDVAFGGVSVAGLFVVVAAVAARFVEALTAVCYLHEVLVALLLFVGLLELAVLAVRFGVLGSAGAPLEDVGRAVGLGCVGLCAFPFVGLGRLCGLLQCGWVIIAALLFASFAFLLWVSLVCLVLFLFCACVCCALVFSWWCRQVVFCSCGGIGRVWHLAVCGLPWLVFVFLWVGCGLSRLSACMWVLSRRLFRR